MQRLSVCAPLALCRAIKPRRALPFVSAGGPCIGALSVHDRPYAALPPRPT
ncbi:MAG: hypothetical protein HXK20_05425 [Alloprevotella tannerae]|nr:hypothetical protein [Alloprevotella tannerae]